MTPTIGKSLGLAAATAGVALGAGCIGSCILSLTTTPLSTLATGVGGNLIASLLEGAARAHPLREFIQKIARGQSLPLGGDLQRLFAASFIDALQLSVKRYVSYRSRGEISSNEREFCSRLQNWAKKLRAGDLCIDTIDPKEIQRTIEEVLICEDSGSVSTSMGATTTSLLTTALTDSFAESWPDTVPRGSARMTHHIPALSSFLNGGVPDELPSGLLGLFAAFLMEGLKTDERCFRILSLSALYDTRKSQEELIEAQRAAFAAHTTEVTRACNREHDEIKQALASFSKRLDADQARVITVLEEQRRENVAPPLMHMPLRAKGDGFIHFRSRGVPFVGREDAKAALWTFLRSPEPLLWTVVTGDAGSGKSRLVFEVLTEVLFTGEFEGGFLRSLHDSNWSQDRAERWHPPRDVVLVVDYAARFEGQAPGEGKLSSLLKLLCELNARRRQANSEDTVRIRIILIDRFSHDHPLGTTVALKQVEECKQTWWPGRNAALDLTVAPEADALFIVSEVKRLTASTESERTLTAEETTKIQEALTAEPQLRRPLFAALLGLALRDGFPPGRLDPERVARLYLDRQAKTFWQADLVQGSDKRLVAAAVAGHGISKQALAELGVEDEEKDALLPKRYGALTGQAIPIRHISLYSPLEPDFVGELFLLRLIDPAETHSAFRAVWHSDAPPAQVIMNAAWAHGQEPAEFLAHLAGDFATHEHYGPLVVQLAQVAAPDPETREWLHALSLVALRFAMGACKESLDKILALGAQLSAQRRDLADAYASMLFAGGLAGEIEHQEFSETRLSELRDLYREQAVNARVRELFAKALYNRAIDLVNKPTPADLAGAGELLVELRGLSQAHPQDSAILEQFAKALVNRATHLVDKQTPADLAGADELLVVLRGLYQTHPQDPAIREPFAKALFNRAINLADRQIPADLAGAGELLVEIRGLYQAHPQDPALREHFAMALVNHATHLVNKQTPADLTGAGELLVELRGLSQAHPQDPALLKQFAKALFSRANHLVNKQTPADLVGAGAPLVELRGLYQTHPQDPAIREHFAKALFSRADHLVNKQTPADLTGAGELLVELRGLSQAHPQDSAILEQFAKALVNRATHLVDKQTSADLAGAGELLVELRGLYQTHPQGPALREHFAMALVNHATHLVNKQTPADLTGAGELLVELRGLSQAHPQDSAILEQFAKALVNRAIDLVDKQTPADLAGAGELLVELRGLYQTHPQGPAIREHFAMALVNHATHLVNKQTPADLTGAGELLVELRGLSQAHPQDSAILEQFAKALVNRANHLVDKQTPADLAGAGELLVELRGLYQAHPQDPALLKQFAKALFSRANHLVNKQTPADLVGAGAPLVELRGLYQTHPQDPTLREYFSMALVNRANHLVDKQTPADLAGAGELLVELRDLYQTHPQDPATLKLLAMALVNRAIDLVDKQTPADLAGAGELLVEVRTLYQAHPQDPAILEQFAMALCNRAIDLVDKQTPADLAGAGELLAEVRTLYQRHPQDPAIREQFAMALVNRAINLVDKQADLAGAGGLLVEVRDVYQTYPQDRTVREAFLKIAIFMAVKYAMNGQCEEARQSIIDLDAVQAAHPDDALWLEWNEELAAARSFITAHCGTR